jgi:hypothetical protein
MSVLAIVSDHGYSIDQSGKLVKTSPSGRVSYHSPMVLQPELGADYSEFCDTYLDDYPLKIELASGDDIHKIFEQHRPGSCMQYKECRELRTIWASNPNDCLVAYATKGSHELLCSDFSCLVYTGKTRNYIDRIYSSGWTYKGMLDRVIQSIADAVTSHNSRPCVSLYYATERFPKYTNKVTFTFQHDSDTLLPYIDTIRYIKDYSSDTVTLTTETTDTCCDSTSGTSVDGEPRYRCCSCNCAVDENDMRSDDNGECYCECCFDDIFSYCEWCEVYVPNDDMRCVQVYHCGRVQDIHICDSSLYDNFTECAGDSCDYVADRDRIELTNGDYISPIDLESGDYVETYYGEVAHSDDCVWCVDIEAYFITEDAHFDEDSGEYYSEPPVDDIAENGVQPINVFRTNGGEYLELATYVSQFAVCVERDTSRPFRIYHVPTGAIVDSRAYTTLDNAVKATIAFDDNLSSYSREYLAGLKIGEKVIDSIVNSDCNSALKVVREFAFI